jgi:peptidoglycan/xylan/chitin deacetylase (PgdA/CDA1 family)
MIWDFKDLSIREIQAPSDVKSNTLKQLTTNTSSTYNPYIFGNATQEWLDKEHSIKILFTPSPEYPPVGNTTQLGFSVQDLKTGINLKNETATLTVINNFTANIGNGANKGSANADFNIFKNISAPNGSFSVKYHFLQTGTHQIIVSIKSKNNVFAALASFNVLVSSNAGSSNSNGLHNRAFSTFSTYFAHPPYSTSSSNIGRVLNSNSKAIMLGFDDGWKSQITYAKPILDKYGLKASFFVVCNYVNSGNIRRMNWQDIARLQKDGMDIESHSMNHPLYLNKLIQKQLDYEIGGSKQCLTSHGYNSTIFAYPYNSGSNDPAVVNTVAKYYNIGRSGTAPLMFLNCIGFKKHPQTDCRTYGSNTVLNYANRYAARSLSFDIVEIKDSFNNTKIFSDFVKVVNSQSTYNHGGKINAVPLIIFHNITFTINRPYNTNAGLFDQLMKYLYEDHFKVLTYKQLGYNTQDNTFYLNGIS